MYGDDGKVKDIYFYRQMSSDEQHTKVSTLPVCSVQSFCNTAMLQFPVHGNASQEVEASFSRCSVAAAQLGDLF